MGGPDHPEPQTFLRRAVQGTATPQDAETLIEADPATAVLRAAGLKPDPDRRLREFHDAEPLCPRVRLRAAGFEEEASISRAELWRFYLPVCALLRQRMDGTRGRVLAGVAGPGACGKTVFAHLLRGVFCLAADDTVGAPKVCGLDGFHYPNAYLESHTHTGPSGDAQSLRAVKGSPPTFDVKQFVAKLGALRSRSRVHLPVYDRRLHDPVPDALAVEPGDPLVIVEGNYLLLEEDGWERVRDLLDVVLFLQQPVEAAREAMIRRHVRGGRTPEDARRYFERVDRPNYELIMRTRGRADLLVRRSAMQRIVAIEPPPEV
ncbi:MAG: hypothetical protein R6X33_07810 [Candidatus Brocadiia bacterium]